MLGGAASRCIPLLPPALPVVGGAARWVSSRSAQLL